MGGVGKGWRSFVSMVIFDVETAKVSGCAVFPLMILLHLSVNMCCIGELLLAVVNRKVGSAGDCSVSVRAADVSGFLS